MFSRFNRYFLAGFLMVAPLAITGYIGYQIVVFVDAEVDKLLPPAWRSIPGLGFIILVFALFLIGFITTGMVGRIINRGIDGMLALLPVPLIRSVYGTLVERWFGAEQEAVLGARYPTLSRRVSSSKKSSSRRGR